VEREKPTKSETVGQTLKKNYFFHQTSWNIVGIFTVVCGSFWRVDKIENGGRCHGNQSFSIQSCRSCYATLHLCQCPFYKIFVKFRNNSLLKMICDRFYLFNFYLRKIVLQEVGKKSFLRENWFEMSDLFSSLLIFTIIETILSTFFLLFRN
jgi:hypothetical protein